MGVQGLLIFRLYRVRLVLVINLQGDLNLFRSLYV